ncbi:hypothetical protein CSPHI_10395 [Corynebacterium sphenisci DSM 44792]|uniref:Helix-turn-helix domain-containing protein n=1 Tax=Corynebacterium sphenisci DSM 44792 TaxID=1437874 RepID=A0A1L7CZM8_9CORY|nr:hypothetical protein CSPHI_10395 [Corynebacterium sphenisci DSM 44792]
MTPPTLSTAQAARVLGVSRQTLYVRTWRNEGVATPEGTVMPIRVGTAVRWPTRPIIDALGLDDDALAAALADAPQPAA